MPEQDAPLLESTPPSDVEVAALGAEEIPGEYSAPPVGTVLKYTHSEMTIKAVSGMEVTARYKDERYPNESSDNDKIFGWLVSANKLSNPESLEALWPLQIGGKVKTNYWAGNFNSRIQGEVTRAEVVTVPAGEFYAYLIEGKTRAIGFNARMKWGYWYAPAIGAWVKFELIGTQGYWRGWERRQELVEIRYPPE